MAASSQLRTPFVVAVAVLLLIWSLLSLDMPYAGVDVSIVDPSASTENQESNTQAEDYQGANGYDQEASPLESAPAPPETTAVVITPTEDALPLETATPISNKPLILYAYSDSASALVNLKFFLAHGLHAAADFVFILNGHTTVASLIPEAENIEIVQRPNDCYDLGAYAEVFQKDDLYKGYKKFIMMNASIRGPFVPYWAESCWTDMYLNKVTDEVKLVGMTANCWPTFHVQSMIWATDLIGLETLLFPPQEALDQLAANPIKLPPLKNKEHLRKPSPETPSVRQAPGINSCFHTWDSAVAAEISSSSLIQAAGFKIDAMMMAYHGIPSYQSSESCAENADVLFDRGYFGTNVGVFETVFMKSNRDVDVVGLKRQTEWVDKMGYSSFDHCRLRD